jgi:agmatinase
MPRRADTSSFDATGAGDPDGSIFGLPFRPDDASVLLVPVPWEATTSYGRGTALGPAAIRAASPQLDLFDLELSELGLGQPWQFGIHMFEESSRVRAWNEHACARALPIIAAGGVVDNDADLLTALTDVNNLSRELDRWVEQEVRAGIDQGRIVGVVGGDHSVAFGAIAAHAAKWPGLGILHVDAHADLRDAYEGFERSHASVLHNVVRRIDGVAKVVQVGIRDLSADEHAMTRDDPRIVTHFDVVMRRALAEGRTWSQLCAGILASLPDHVYVTFDVDGLDPALCPSTGTPVPGGLSFTEATSLLCALVRAGKTVVGFDLVEVAPSKRPGDEWDGNVGARLLYKLCGVALASQGARDA